MNGARWAAVLADVVLQPRRGHVVPAVRPDLEDVRADRAFADGLAIGFRLGRLSDADFAEHLGRLLAGIDDHPHPVEATTGDDHRGGDPLPDGLPLPRGVDGFTVGRRCRR